MHKEEGLWLQQNW